MAIANYFHNQTTRKYVALFGTYFNQLKIQRLDGNGAIVNDMIVPISYAPWQKILARIDQDPNLNRKQAISLPRMSFEMTSMSYDGDRKISPIQKLRKTAVDPTSGERNFLYAGTPYNLEFSLYIMTKYNEDATKIVEQILPFFNPEFTSTVRIIDDIDPIDVPLILNGVTNEELYEGEFSERKSILWTLNFTMKAWYYGPQKEKKVIKFIDTRFATDTADDAELQTKVTVQPGLTANGEPTTDANNSIDYSDIEFDDDWAYIIAVDDI